MSTIALPTIGRIVHYKLTEDDANAVNGRRLDGDKHRRQCEQEGGWQESIPVGNPVAAGDVFPLIITKVFDQMPPGFETEVNGQVLLDGNDSHWVTSVPHVHQHPAHTPNNLHPERSWIWPARV